MQRFRQAEPSWLRRGQTTTLFSSLTEKEPVKGARGGIASIDSRGLDGAVRGVGAWQQTNGWGQAAFNGGRTGLKQLCEAPDELQRTWTDATVVNELCSELVGACGHCFW